MTVKPSIKNTLGAKPAVLICLLLLACTAIVTESWVASPYWIDSRSYTLCVVNGWTVAHPPGYLLFIAVGRGINHWVENPFFAFQLLSFGSYLASIPFLYLALRQWAGERPSLLVAAAYAISWVPLMTASNGIPHVCDLLFASALVAVIGSRPFAEGRPAWIWALIAILALAGGIRMSTLVMWSPIMPLLWLLHPKKAAVWIGTAALVLFILGLTALTAKEFGGWQIYRQETEALNHVNAFSSLILSGFTKTTLLNFGRATLWVGIQCNVLLLFTTFWKPQIPRDLLEPRVIQIAMILVTILGPLFVMFFYLATHPGYLAPALPGIFVMAAILWSKASPSLANRGVVFVGLSAVTSLGMFYGLHFTANPTSVRQAVVNSLLLQYSRDGMKKTTLLTTSEWLIKAGNTDLVPANRMKEIEKARQRSQ